ncbi:MAG: hypothetical protein LBS60_08815 [Deltaproteobacteria bacterium]|jgi:hypothetical protein|nr:hypothetical protein [Deltaproteobacteria bacterium]
MTINDDNDYLDGRSFYDVWEIICEDILDDRIDFLDMSDLPLRIVNFDGADAKNADFRKTKNLDKARWPKGWKLVKDNG